MKVPNIIFFRSYSSFRNLEQRHRFVILYLRNYILRRFIGNLKERGLEIRFENNKVASKTDEGNEYS